MNHVWKELETPRELSKDGREQAVLVSGDDSAKIALIPCHCEVGSKLSLELRNLKLRQARTGPLFLIRRSSEVGC